MADTSSVDILMMLKAGGTAIVAESMSTVESETGWTDDFTTGKYFEISDFDFGINVVDSDSTASSKDQTKSATGQTPEKKSGRFSRWVQNMAATAGPGASGTIYPVEMEPFSFSRQIDCASPLIFKNCFKTIPFDSAALVMRKTGGVSTGLGGVRGITSTAAVPFLRIDFTGVLFVAIDWDGGELVKEKCKFVSRSIKVKYRTQKHSGGKGDLFYTGPLDLQKATG
jgi:type VI protein secretion system component Hcp